jgi:hypothetical protein
MPLQDCSLGDALQPRNLLRRINQQGIFKATSYHPGGVHALLMDGSLRFFRNSINIKIWRALATRSGGEIIDF